MQLANGPFLNVFRAVSAQRLFRSEFEVKPLPQHNLIFKIEPNGT